MAEDSIEPVIEITNEEPPIEPSIVDKYSHGDFIDPPKLSKVSTLNIDCLTLQYVFLRILY